MPERIIFNAFEMNCLAHMAHGLWAHPADNRRRYTELSYWTDLAELLERGRFDALFLADVLGVYDTYGGSRDPAVAGGVQVPANDPLLTVPAMAARTEHLGFAVSVSTSYEPPFGHARRLSTLDHLTRGRVGWNVVTSYLPGAARNFGHSRMTPHDERYDRADEYLEVCYRLWEESWEDGAVLADRERQRYADPAKVHAVDHAGTWFDVAGPHLCEPSPQRTPVLYQAGNSPRGREFAARHAECVFLSGVTPEGLRRDAEDIRARAAAQGRDPRGIRLLTSLAVVVAGTGAEARHRYAELQGWVDREGMLAQFCGTSGFDLHGRDRAAPLVPHRTDHGQGAAALFAEGRPDGPTVGETADNAAALGRTTLLAVGSPGEVADRIEGWVEETGLDGFNLVPFLAPGSFTDFVDLVVPELQRRGRYRTEYEPGTFREQLFGPGAALLPADHPGGRIRAGGASARTAGAAPG
ncbi:LLM class flavin-dependent oxidoreductase [Streptomyces sp. HNM0574]|uniref:LLM class flavin-dependent oxidoreductase n=1 Tax=Streptomyces sp. HNM0574 TaxID=2714954 RepID=UPI00146DC14C|nr:LLM class flavin-dependent oxidoreductase [Streptomyces sp. HNM0574]NLU70760.1 LLM class flavin-dependent oxidoreductase [Streptomyces sp. HNM0574]